jgi:hypothetical protein
VMNKLFSELEFFVKAILNFWNIFQVSILET